MNLDQLIQTTGAPQDQPIVELDVRTLPPPKPLRQTLEHLADADAEQVIVQYNDRPPQHLYPQLDDRGYEYESTEQEETVVTVIWSS